MKAIFSRHLLTMWTSSARACSISALLLFCFLAPCSARADSTDVFPDVEFDSETLQAVTNLAKALSLSSDGTKATTATVEQNVAAILALLQNVSGLFSANSQSVLRTFPMAGGISSSATLGSYLFNALGENWTVRSSSRETGFLYEIQRALYGQSGVPSSGSAVVPLLLSMYGSTTNIELLVETILTMADDIDYHAGSIDNMFNLLSTEYYIGAHPYMWDVHIDDSQLGAISDGFDWLGGYLSNVVEHVGADMGGYLSNIDPYVSDIASAVDAEYESGNMADEYEVSDEYIPDDLFASTNDLGQLEIEPGKLPNIYHILDGVDSRDFNMLPSLTGADPVIEVFRADRSSNLPAFSIDFSVPPGIYNLISLFSTWLWRVLFFVAMWRLVEGEYNYWTTLGGGA